MIGAVFEVLAASRTRWRRARNLRAGTQARPAPAWPARTQRPAFLAACLLSTLRSALRLRLPPRPQSASAPGSAQLARLRMPGPLARLSIGAILLTGAGAWTIATHARWLDAASGEGALTDAGLAALQPALAGIAFDVPAGSDARLETHAGAALLILSGMRAEPARRIDLCSQMLDPAHGRLLPLRIGYRFDEIAALATGSAPVGTPALTSAGAPAGPLLPLRNVVLADEAMPRIDIRGNAVNGAPLSVRWQGEAQWTGDGVSGDGSASAVAASAALQRQGWLLWRAQDGRRALRVLRRTSAACPQAGELVLQLYRPAYRPEAGGTAAASATAAPGKAPARALVAAFPAHGAPIEVRLAPGSYRVPQAAPAELEDRQLFDRLRACGLVRLGAGGLAELAPPDLFAWRALAGQGTAGAAGATQAGDAAGVTGPAAGATGAASWHQVQADPETRTLLQHLYQRADGAFVREQLRIFNSERRLLAWQVRAADATAYPGAAWRIDAGGMPAPLAQDMPMAAARLFARLPQGWAPWQRVAAWPAGDTARLRLALGAPARPGATIRLMLAGRLLALQGARLAGTPAAACSGRACRTPDQVQVLDLQLEPGARELVLDAAPLGMDALAAPGDARYRHVIIDDGRLAWQSLPVARAAPTASTPARLAQVSLEDRNGAPLWHDGTPTGAAVDAGLATLLGVRAQQQSGVAGMLARLPARWRPEALPAGPQAGRTSAPHVGQYAGQHTARLTIDLGLQHAAQAALDCIGMRQGRWDGRACTGGSAPAPGRQAGLVLLDAQTGDVLAAAGAGAGKIDDANWREVRDFDRVDPAASPLRLPAFQHDGGAERSPGSTFKIVSALGLELAARRDPRLDSLLDGQPLAAINTLARERGFDFRTDAPGYPAAGRARITNFRDQGLDRRAQDGRLGLAQALSYSLNTWFAWTGELSDRSLLGAPTGGVPDLQPLAPGALDDVRPIVAMARRLGFGQALRLDGGLLPLDYPWSAWDALQASPAGIDPIHTRHELRQMAIGLRMQATPLQMALVAAAVGQGSVVNPRLLAQLDGRDAASRPGQPLGVRLDRIRAGMKGVVDAGTAAGAFHGPELDRVRRGLFGKTGTAPVGNGDLATVWFTGWLEPHSLPGQAHRLALAVFVSQSDATGGGHAAPVAAAVLRHLALQPRESGMK